jgi:hypothetical protein
MLVNILKDEAAKNLQRVDGYFKMLHLFVESSFELP